MSQVIKLSGIGARQLRVDLQQALVRSSPQVIGVAAAFVSVKGVQELHAAVTECGIQKCRLVAGIDGAITHPQALQLVADFGWALRIGTAQKSQGIFHPKLIVAGSGFASDGSLRKLSCVYVGSSNLTAGGLTKNIECGLLAEAAGCDSSASVAFAELWRAAKKPSSVELKNYAATFAERARHRRLSELRDLGISDATALSATTSDILAQSPPEVPAVDSKFAIAAWTGLQSFTGQYRFQVEFPRYSGDVISRLVRNRADDAGRVDVYCPDDDSTQAMQYRFYSDNSMFRLNIPNDYPGVSWARQHRDGIAIVEKGPPGGAPIRLRILQPGSDTGDIIGRSAVLGTWGKTTTRAYGWF